MIRQGAKLWKVCVCESVCVKWNLLTFSSMMQPYPIVSSASHCLVSTTDHGHNLVSLLSEWQKSSNASSLLTFRWSALARCSPIINSFFSPADLDDHEVPQKRSTLVPVEACVHNSWIIRNYMNQCDEKSTTVAISLVHVYYLNFYPHYS